MRSKLEPEERARGQKIYSILKKKYPDAHCELDFKNPLELLVATILSAQCTDVKVNQVTKTLFVEYKTPRDYVEKPLSHLEGIIRPTGFYRNKAKNIQKAMAAILEKHKGKVPQSMEDLVELPGVGRKTANVLLGNAFDLPGLPVDTHVGRISHRLGFTDEEDPVKIEFDLHRYLSPKDWCQFSHTIIFHGRKICKARNPLCSLCPVQEFCRYYEEKNNE